MNFRQGLVYYSIVVTVQLIQLSCVVAIAVINDAVFEFVGLYLGLITGKIVFKKSWHAKSILVCSLLTFVIFFFLTRTALPPNISITCSFLLGIVFAYVLYLLSELEERVDTKICIKDEIGSTKVDLKNLPIEEIRNLCIKNCFSETDTNFLIDFIKNPKGLKKYEIAIKYNYERSYIYQRARKLIKILEGK